jgi:predicted HicB family RNase H-like nuclease
MYNVKRFGDGKLVQTRIDAATYRVLVRTAEAEGISVASYVRRMLIRLRDEVSKKEFKEPNG